MRLGLASIVVAACLAIRSESAVSDSTPALAAGPQLGELCPPHGLSYWIQGKEQHLSALRGRVVVLHTFAWNCDSCLRKGIPLSVDLKRANPPEELEVISITTPAERENTRKVVQDMGMTQPIAVVNPMGTDSPYVDMANGITYMWVVGRNGELVWRGDPSNKEEECLEAVRLALADRADRLLEREPHAALAQAAGCFARGEYRAATEAAAKLLKEHARKQKPDSQAIAADAQHLIDRVAGRLAALTTALASAAQERDAVAFTGLREEIQRGFSKKDAAAAVQPADAALADPAFDSATADAKAWLALKHARPPLLGVRQDKAADKYVKALREFLAKNADGPYAMEARAILSRGEEAQKKR